MNKLMIATAGLAMTATSAFANEPLTRGDIPHDSFGTGGICIISTGEEPIVIELDSLPKCFDYARMLSSTQPLAAITGIVDAQGLDQPFGFRCEDTQCSTIEID